MRLSTLVTSTALVWGAACSTPDRAFSPGGDGGAATTGVTSTSSSTSTSGPAGPGAGGDTSTTDATSSSSQGGGLPSCGDGVVDDGEECDEDTPLCQACVIDCPEGWFRGERSCFAVALQDVATYDAFTADAKCGALDVAATGHRAHAAAPHTLQELDDLASRCPSSGCWLGFYALGLPGDTTFGAPSTGEALLGSPPWNAGEPTGAAPEVCLKLLSLDGGPALDDQDCNQPGYFACELSPSFGRFATCGDGVLDAGEECDDDDPTCIGCDRQCVSGWREDPRTHTCLTAAAENTWAADLCGAEGGRLATPDDVADARILRFIGSNAWIGLDASVPSAPTWISGEAFDYVPGTFPLPDAAPSATYGVLSDGQISFATADVARGVLCEAFDPDD